MSQPPHNSKVLREKKFEDKQALVPFLKRILKYSYRHKKWFWGFVISIFFMGIIDALWPLIWMYFIDLAIVPGINAYWDAKNAGTDLVLDYSNVYKYGGLFFINGFLSVIAVYAFVYFAGRIQERVLYELRKEMFEKLQGLSFSFFDKSQSGWLLSRITSDADKVSALISWGFLDCVWGVTMIVACMVSMFYYQWKLALIVSLSIPVLFLASIKLRLLILKFSRASRRLNSEVIASYTEHINGVDVNKATAQEMRVSDDFSDLSGRMRKATFKAGYFTAMYNPIVIFIASATAILVIYFGGNMVASAGLTLGIFAAFFRYATRIFDPILEITHFYAFAQSSLSAGERIFGLLDEKTDIKDSENAGTYERGNTDIVFENVDFAYVADNPVLQNFNLHVKPGQSIAIVGPTGEGKSTIINLIARFYEPNKGRILIGGKDYTTQTLHSLRRQLGVVLQTPHLFAGTVRDNVRYAKPTADDTEIIEALKMVAADDLVNRLDEEVGEGGEKLSMGERQLISFARAILADPDIFIMDEATSSIDTLAEAKIQKGIQQMLEGRTAFIIAHRLSTIKNCDRILVINKGQIMEDGSHKELMKQQGKYYKLYTKQLRESGGLTQEENVATVV